MQSFTRANREAVIAASRDPSVRRAAKELDSRVDDAGIDPDAVAEARRVLSAAVAHALALAEPHTPEIVVDFAMQAALFAVGAPVFIVPSDTNLAEWIASMPDDALDGLRKSMAETSRAMGDSESVAKVVDIPKEAFASILARSAPKAVSGLIVDGDQIFAPNESTPSKPQREAMRALSADAAGAEPVYIREMAARQGGLVRRLRRFSFPAVAARLAGLLTRAENHTATIRIEALLHLAALACRGKKKPGQQQLREWLTEIYEDPITKVEIPVEDVFVSNVEASFGNARLFQGRWENSAEYVRAYTETLLWIGEERLWARGALRHIVALLRVSEALAERSGAERYARTESTPRKEIVLRVSTVKESSRHVVFSDEDLAVIGVEPRDLDPFLIRNEHAGRLAAETMGHSALERRPLVRFRRRTTVALPTAIGAAIRRFATEQAAAAGDQRLFGSKCHLAQVSEALRFGLPGWGIEDIERPEPDSGDMREFIGRFDEGGYAHLVFVPDASEVVTETRLADSRPLQESVRKRVREGAAEIAGRQGYRRGLTILLHGGVGPQFSSALEELSDSPSGWHRLCVSAPDFTLLGEMPDFTAMRAWKLLHQVDELKTRGILFRNPRGFLNLVAYANWVGFELVPEDMGAGTVYLRSDFILPIRHQVRTALDRHAAMTPGKEAWVGVQRQSAADRFDEIQGRGEYFSVARPEHGEVLACVESALGPWWVYISDGIPDEPLPGTIVSDVLRAALGWLARLIPEFEERYPMLPPGPVTFQLRFPDIGNFGQSTVALEQPSEAPAVTIEDGRIVVGCGPRYLQSFLGPGNLGDRLMIAAMARGIETLCSNEPLPSTAMEEWVQTVAGSDNDRFLQIRLSRTPDGLVYDGAALPKLRLPMPEDLAWSRLGLARRAGYKGEPGPIPPSRAGKLVNAAVDVVWRRVEERLKGLSRESTVERALLNYIAARKEHRDWSLAIAPRLAVYDASQVMDTAIKRVTWRDIASQASRVVAEMALCTSPCEGGAACTDTDLDFLIAEVWTLVECANQSDAMRYRLAARPPTILSNGSFEFDVSAVQVSTPMMRERWRRKFRGETEQLEEVEGLPDPEFDRAFAAEFGLSIEQYGEFVHRMAMDAVGSGDALLKLRRSEVVQRLLDAGVPDPERAFKTLVLCPRGRWDETLPKNAEARDWYPWRHNRRLSVLRRPIVQWSRGDDPAVILAPSMLANTLGYLAMAEVGGRPETLFDSREMIAFVGRAADRNGHEFTLKVEKRLAELGWKTTREVGLTRFGGADSLGDVDVLCWRQSSGVLYVIECKSLRFDSTLGEIGERLAEFAAGTVERKRTPLQKHLDRMSFLEANRKALADFTGISEPQLRLRSALVTEGLGSMQFGGEAREKLNVVTDYELLGDHLLDL